MNIIIMENTDLNFDIKTTIKEDFLSIAACGSYSLLKANNLFKFSIDEGLLHHKSKVLIDVTKITGVIPFGDRYEYSEFLANYIIKHALAKVRSVAVVGKEPIVHKERFGETVAINRGANVRVFTDISEASLWLNQQ
ncbi:MAG: hypothetical protein JWN78_2882 [Bacteroidota bacterium]|nr:hypothetical protein [Bacteroidota bacterium]